jgi:hypothetical protein
MPDRRELYRSPNGDTWFLGREPTSRHAFIIHQPNAPSGGRLSPIELGEFLRCGWAGTTSIVAPDRNAGGGATLCLERQGRAVIGYRSYRTHYRHKCWC